jgi:hypothetical protein
MLSSIAVGQLLQTHTRLSTLLDKMVQVADTYFMVSPIAGVVARDYTLIDALKKEGRGCPPIVSIVSIKEGRAIVRDIVNPATSSKKITYDVPLSDLFPLDGVAIPITIGSKLYGSHKVFLKVDKSMISKEGLVPISVAYCEISKTVVDKIEEHLKYFHKLAEEVHEASKHTDNIQKLSKKTLADLKKSPRSLLFTKHIEEVLEKIGHKDFTKQTGDEMQSSMELLEKRCTELSSRNYIADDLMRFLKSTTMAQLVEDNGKTVIMASPQLILGVLLPITQHNNKTILGRNLSGRKVLYKPNGERCTILTSLGNGEVIVEFPNSVEGGHSLDGLKKTGTCLNTDESNLEIKKDTTITKIEINIIKQQQEVEKVA